LLGPLQAHTPNTITSIDVLHADLNQTRERGWAVNREEWRLGVCGLGAPVFNALSKPVAAVGMSVPTIRFGSARAKSLANRLAVCARDASQALGYNP
jgi:DNA-binding IclR family transcriptional regulator